MDDCTVVTITTLQGGTYEFPDMPRAMLKTVLSSPWHQHDSFILVNVYGSVLSMQARLIKSIWFDGELQVSGPNAPK